MKLVNLFCCQEKVFILMNIWMIGKSLMKQHYLKKKNFIATLNKEDITDADYMHAKRVCKDFEIKNLGEYHDLYLKSDTLLLADVFENFRKMCLKLYHLDPVKFLSAPGLAWQAALKKTEVKLELLTDIDMLLMVEKGIRGGICHAIHQYAKANNKYMKDYDKNKESSYLKYWDVNNLYGWAMSQKLPVNNFEWIEETSQFNEDFIKNYSEESDEGYFLKLMFNTQNSYMNFIMIYHFYQKE